MYQGQQNETVGLETKPTQKQALMMQVKVSHQLVSS